MLNKQRLQLDTVSSLIQNRISTCLCIVNNMFNHLSLLHLCSVQVDRVKKYVVFLEPVKICVVEDIVFLLEPMNLNKIMFFSYSASRTIIC